MILVDIIILASLALVLLWLVLDRIRARKDEHFERRDV